MFLSYLTVVFIKDIVLAFHPMFHSMLLWTGVEVCCGLPLCWILWLWF